MEPTPARSDDPRAMYRRWIALWNGELALADALVAADCPIHQPPNTLRGPDDLRRLVEKARAPLDDLVFAVEGEPVVEGNRLAARWTITGRYRGGYPGTTARAGMGINFGGIDIWRVEDGRIVECRIESDGLRAIVQLERET